MSKFHNKITLQTARIQKGQPKLSSKNKRKRQRNAQQVKEQESCPPNQTKEEVGNLPEKEFRILIVKMIQNLEIKMESQINTMETRIEMQERLNKDLEEIKKRVNL